MADDTASDDTTTAHDCGHDHSQVPESTRRQMAEVTASIEALDLERRHLLVNQALLKVDNMIDSLAEAVLKTGDTETLSLLAIMQSTLGLAGLTLAQITEEHEDWTRTADRKVEAVWDQFTVMVRGLVGGGHGAVKITEADLPEDVIKRVAAGQGTEEDLAAVRKVVAEKAGVDVEELALDKTAVLGKDGKMQPLSGQRPGKPDEFVPRRDKDGVPVDETGHQYGGQYL
jgi:hypothetical protein